MEDNNTTPPLPYELKLGHQLKHKPRAKAFTIDVTINIFKQRSDSDPFVDVSFSTTVDEFIWEDVECPEKVALQELLINVGIIEFEAIFLVNDIILYVNHKTLSLHKNYKGVFTLLVQVILPPEPVRINHTGSEQTQSHELPEPVQLNYAGSEQTQPQKSMETGEPQRLPPEPVELNHTGSGKITQFQEPVAATKTRGQRIRRLKPRANIQRVRYIIGSDGYSMVLGENPVKKVSQ